MRLNKQKNLENMFGRKKNKKIFEEFLQNRM